MQRLAQSPTDPAFVQDPYPFYERARAAGPFFFWEDYGLVCTGNAAAVNAALRDRRLGREVPPEARPTIPPRLAPFYAVEAHSMLELEPPRHTRLRGLVLRAFTAKAIAGLAPVIAAKTEALIAALPRGAAFDLLPGFATPLPVFVITHLLGLPESCAPDLLRWSHAMVAMYQARRDGAVEAAAVAATQEFVAFLQSEIAARRRAPGEDLLSHLIAAEEDGARLSTDEMITTVILLLNAGHEATVHSLGNGVKALLEAGAPPAWFAPEGIAATVEEVLRYDPPLHLFTRWVYEPVEILGQRFERGQEIGLLLGAANRDPGPWEDPARFWPERAEKPHVSFGAGLHFCIGAPLARLELQIALPRLFVALPGLRLTEKPRYADLYHFRGLEALWVQSAA